MQVSGGAPSLDGRRRNTTRFVSQERWSPTYSARHFSDTEKERSAIVDNVICVAIADGKGGSFVAYRDPFQCVGQCCRVELGEHCHQADLVAD